MKIAAVGDLFLDAATLTELIPPALPKGVAFAAVQWPLRDLKELQGFNLKVEQGGPDAVPVAPEVLAAVKDADIVFTQFWPVSAQVMAASPKLRVIAVGRSGVENIAVAEATKRGICVLNTVGRNAQAVAEYAIGLMLCEMRNISRGHAALRRGEWRKKFPNDASVPELPGRTLGLVGFGQIGRLMVKKLAGFEMNFLAYDPYAKPEPGVEFVDLPTLMKRSDFVSIHAKLTDETRKLINRELLALMKPTAYLINTARAELVDEAALAETLRQGKIAGAALDVFMHEPPAADDPLLQLDNVTLSPHQAGVTVDAYRTTVKLFLQNIRRLWAGSELPANLVNRETGEKLREFKTAVSAGCDPH